MSGIVESSADARSKTIGQNFRCRAWINFEGDSGSIGSGRANGNVSSVTDNGASQGNYTINFTTAMPDDDYCTVAIMGFVAAAFTIRLGDGSSGTYSASAVQVTCFNASGVLVDPNVVNVAVFR